MTIDPRLIERRKEVAEARAQRNIGRLLRFLAVLVVAGLAIWVVLSPWMSVEQVRTAGIAKSSANQILADADVVAGRPLVLIRAGHVEDLLTTDPWVRDARVHLNWPNEVIVRVEERVPLLWVETGDGWFRRDLYGVAVPGPNSPDESLPWLQITDTSSRDAEASAVVLGAAEFVAALEDQLSSDLRLRVEAGELWATAAGYEVRLGRPIEMRAKALGLVALLRESIVEGSTLVLVAPTNPAVSPPVSPTPAQGDADSSETSSEGGDASGSGAGG
jgi:cell division protein FtsQ